jgi:8-oxo-dGTP diphosphatase
MGKPLQKIAIAIIEHDGRYLLGTRQAGTHLAGKTEFPGGKCESGESIQDCLVRESLEEAGIKIIPVEEFYRTQHSYSHADVDLHFWICKPVDQNGVISDSHFWVSASELSQYSFPDANQSVIEKLIERKHSL